MSEEQKPQLIEPSKDWPHYQLWRKIRSLLEELPTHFKSTLNITSAVNVTEIYAFGTALSYTIEEEVVNTLNRAKGLWDPDGEYCNYLFIRQAQSFPDVLFLETEKKEIIMGIELKSWYLLAKEGEPSFRYKVTSAACAPQDLLVIVPWALSNVVTGNPVVFEPFVISAKYAAEYRNYWWKHLRKAEGNTEIFCPEGVSCYPASREKIDDEPAYDPGRNFGRLARTEIMDRWVKKCKKEKLLGIEIEKWIEFFKTGKIKHSKTCGKQLKLL
jgi:hypothetical protein